MCEDSLSTLKIAFFGTPEFATVILDKIKWGGVMPSLIVTNPDAPYGRKLVLTPPPAKLWAEEHNVPIIQPNNFKTVPVELGKNFDIFLIAAYGKIIPGSIINLPKYGTICMHPSLLPKYRGPSPVQNTILNGDDETGVSIMLVDQEIDHGPVIAREKISLKSWRPTTDELKKKLAEVGAKLLLKVLPDWVAGKIKAEPQDHSQASFTKKFGRTDGLIEGADILNENLDLGKVETIERKVRALNPEPGVFTFIQTKTGKKLRVKITKAKIQDGKLIIEKVVPEGKREMIWEDFKRGNL